MSDAVNIRIDRPAVRNGVDVDRYRRVLCVHARSAQKKNYDEQTEQRGLIRDRHENYSHFWIGWQHEDAAMGGKTSRIHAGLRPMDVSARCRSFTVTKGENAPSLPGKL